MTHQDPAVCLKSETHSVPLVCLKRDDAVSTERPVDPPVSTQPHQDDPSTGRCAIDQQAAVRCQRDALDRDQRGGVCTPRLPYPVSIPPSASSLRIPVFGEATMTRPSASRP